MKGAADRAAVSPQGRRRPARDRPSVSAARRAARAARSGALSRSCGLAVLIGARHLAARTQGLEGRSDRDAERRGSGERRSSCRRRANGRALDREQAEFTPRAASRAAFLDGGDALVYTGGSALRDDVKGAGYFVFSAGATGRRQRGRGQSRLRAESRKASGSAGPAAALRDRRRCCAGRSAVAGSSPTDDAAGDVWYRARPSRRWRAPRAGATVAPFYVEQEAPVPPGGCRSRRRSTSHCRNNHLQYALTWYRPGGRADRRFCRWRGSDVGRRSA